MLEEIKPESIEKARQWFIDNGHGCIKEAESGEVFVNDLSTYREKCLENIEAHKNGKFDHTFTFQQKAYFFQTGHSVALLA